MSQGFISSGRCRRPAISAVVGVARTSQERFCSCHGFSPLTDYGGVVFGSAGTSVVKLKVFSSAFISCFVGFSRAIAHFGRKGVPFTGKETPNGCVSTVPNGGFVGCPSLDGGVGFTNAYGGVFISDSCITAGFEVCLRGGGITTADSKVFAKTAESGKGASLSLTGTNVFITAALAIIFSPTSSSAISGTAVCG